MAVPAYKTTGGLVHSGWLNPLSPLHYTHQFITMVLLVTSDNEQFVVDKEVAERSVLIKNMLEGTLSAFSACLNNLQLARHF